MREPTLGSFIISVSSLSPSGLLSVSLPPLIPSAAVDSDGCCQVLPEFTRSALLLGEFVFASLSLRGP